MLAKTEAALKDIKKAEDKRAAERREFERERAKLEDYRDLRDDLMSAVKNSGMSYEDIHGRCGPHPHTLENWAEKRVDQPRLGKMRSTARIIGLELAWVEKRASGA